MSNEKPVSFKPVGEGNRKTLLLGLAGVAAVLVVVGMIIFRPAAHRPTPVPPSAAQSSAQKSAAPQEPAAPAEAPPAASEEAASASESASSSAEAPAAASASTPAHHPHAHHAHPGEKALARTGHPAHHIGSGAGTAAGAGEPAVAPAETPTIVVGGRRDPDAPFRKVSLADLNLASDSGACKAYRRITVAADEVCPYNSDERDLGLYRVHEECYHDAVARAVHDIHAPKLSRLLVDRHAGGC